MLAHSLALVLALTAGTATVATFVSQPADKASATPPAAQPAAAAKPAELLAPVAFLSGRWVHVDAKGATEEHWSSPRGGAMMGMFRWDRPDGSPVMFEILTITAEGEDVLLRLRHYSPKLIAKEDKDKPMTLKLTEKSERKAVFTPMADADSLTRIEYHCPDPDRLKISVVLAAAEGAEPTTLEFDLTREGKGGK